MEELGIRAVQPKRISHVALAEVHLDEQSLRALVKWVARHDGEGHFAGFSAVADVLDRIREVWGDQTAEPVAAAPPERPRRTRKRPSQS